MADPPGVIPLRRFLTLELPPVDGSFLPIEFGGERGIRTRKEALQINKLLKQKRAKAP